MRRTLLIMSLSSVATLACAATLATPAVAKSGHEITSISISPAPSGGLSAGDPWNATITIDSATPRRTGQGLRETGVTVSFDDPDTGAGDIVEARPTGDPLVWHARIRFPRGGTYGVRISALGTEVQPASFWVSPARAQGSAAAEPRTAGSVSWGTPAAAGITAIILAAAGAVFARRHRRQA
jgi:hypothetical protein